MITRPVYVLLVSFPFWGFFQLPHPVKNLLHDGDLLIALLHNSIAISRDVFTALKL